MPQSSLDIVIGPAPDPILHFAAEELCGYVEQLFHVQATVRADAPKADATIFLDADPAGVKPPGKEEAFILRRFDRSGSPALAAVGGSPRATLWAVYDLVERWGVRYLLRGDALPEAPGPFHLPDVDVTREPNLGIRGARLLNLFSMGLESWSLADMCRYIDQLAKLKFNKLYHQLWCWQPYVHYECRGVAKRTGTHWFGWHYPIDEHSIGRHLFGGVSEFVPPDFEGCRTYQERVAVGTHLVRESLAHAARRGMETQIATGLTDFPVEFCHLLGMPPLAPHGMGLALSGGHKGADDPAFQDLCAAALRAYIDTYPDVDSYSISMPEFHAESAPYEVAWARLDAKYGFNKVRTLGQVLEQAASRTDFAGGADRMVRNTKGDIVALDLFDRLLTEKKILDDCVKPDADVHFTAVAEELSEVFNLMRPEERVMATLDYTTSRMVKRPHAFERIRQAGLRPTVTMTTQDDNIGVIPQNATASIHELLGVLRKADWEGFVLRYWMICDMEPTMAYLAAATWDETVTPHDAYQDHAKFLCGEQAQDDLIASLEILDQVTIGLGDHGLGIGFPVPTMGVNFWYRGKKLADKFVADREEYRKALNRARAALAKATRGQRYLRYIMGRLEFGIAYFDMIDALQRAGQANKDGDRAVAVEGLECGIELARRAVTLHAGITQDGTDLGTLAQLNEDLNRKLTRLLKAVRAGKKWTMGSERGAGGVLVE